MSKNNFKVGDIILSEDHNNETSMVMNELRETPQPDITGQHFCVYHFVDIDKEHNIGHVKIYADYNQRPNKDNYDNDKYLFCLHSPIDLNSIQSIELLDHRTPSDDDLEGYYHYLKTNHYEDYLERAGKDFEEEIEKAVVAYQKGVEIMDDDPEKALEHFYEAIDTYPHEIIYYDAAGSCLLDMEMYEDALHCYEDALQYAEDNDEEIINLFIGCGYALYYLDGRESEAKAYFERALEKDHLLDQDIKNDLKNALQQLK